MTSKRQFLDPIGAGCRLILLYFSEPRTKIRIHDHAIQLVPETVYERAIWRKFVYQDSRSDLHVLYPMIVRFIELYLIERKHRSKTGTPMLAPSIPPKTLSVLDDSEGLFDQTDMTYIKSPVVRSEPEGYSKSCYECLKKLAEYIICGLTELEKTYGYDNATFTCKYYSNLLRAGINETYNVDMLPADLKDLTAHNLLDVSKIKNLWKDSDIITLLGFFEKCFEAHRTGDNKAIDGNKAAIEALLNRADEEFRKIVNSTDSA